MRAEGLEGSLAELVEALRLRTARGGRKKGGGVHWCRGGYEGYET